MTSKDEFNQQVNKMYDRLVKLGYAHPTVSDYSTQEINLCLTDSGLKFRKDLLSVFGLKGSDSIKSFRPDEFIVFFTVFASFEES